MENIFYLCFFLSSFFIIFLIHSFNKRIIGIRLTTQSIYVPFIH